MYVKCKDILLYDVKCNLLMSNCISKNISNGRCFDIVIIFQKRGGKAKIIVLYFVITNNICIFVMK